MIGRAGKEGEAGSMNLTGGLQRAIWMEQLGTGRAENPFWKTVADLPKTHAASQYFENTRNHLPAFPEVKSQAPSWMQLHDIKAVQLGWHMSPSRLSLGGSAGLEKTTRLNVTVPTFCRLEREILWILTGLLGLSPGSAPRLQEEYEQGKGCMLLSSLLQVIRDMCSPSFFGRHVPSLPPLTGASDTQPSISPLLLTHPHLPPTYFHFLLYISAERFLNLTVTQRFAPSVAVALQESIPIPPPCHSFMVFTCFRRFSFSCSFPFLQRQDIEEGQQRAKSTRAESGERWAFWF